MPFPTRTTTVTVKDLTNSTPAEAIQLATQENELLTRALNQLENPESIAPGGERTVKLSNTEYLLTARSLKADLEINNAILAAAHSAISESN